MKYIDTSKNICCDDVIQCIFNLNSLDIKVYRNLNEKKAIRADELANKLNKERSTVYRSLQKLNCAGLCNKETKKIESGGYYHVYSSNNSKDTKEKLQKCIDKWYEKMKETIEQIS